jgi:TonB-dependent starch-binding outer membrane protein SusC
MGTSGFADDFYRYNNIGAATTPDPPGSSANLMVNEFIFPQGQLYFQGKVYGNVYRTY